MSKLMLINNIEGHECRIAILANNKLEELYTERASHASQVGNIYKGRVSNIEPSIQAAFIDFGEVKNGFLHISDLHPKYFPKSEKQLESVGRRSSHRSRPPIQECLKPGQEIVVQMTKQGIGTKGPTMTTYLSIPGRLLVTMPDMTHVGISRKIEDEEDRAKLKEVLGQLDIPDELGVIVRTAGIGRTKRELQRDLAYLMRLWKSVDQRVEQTKAPAEIYKESDLVIRTLRDVFDADITRIICDNDDVASRVQEFLEVAVPRAKCKIQVYKGAHGLFREFGMEEEIRKIHSRRVELDNGGSLVIDQTEALVAIDVNSGSFRKHKSAEQNALHLNLAAADEIARQLRLRDMGGVIIIDFVDMREEKNRRELEKKVRELLKEDRAKSKILRISQFGLIQMTRQRLRPSLKQSIYQHCPHCDGTGMVLTDESVALSVIRSLRAACSNRNIANIELEVAPEVAHYLLNTQRQLVTDLEKIHDKSITITSRHELSCNDVNITCTNLREAVVSWDLDHPRTTKELAKQLVDINKGKSKSKKAEQSSKSQPAEDKNESHVETEEKQEEKQEKKPARKKRGKRGGRKHKKNNHKSNEGNEKNADAKKAEQPVKSKEEKSETKADNAKKQDTPPVEKPDSNNSAEQPENSEEAHGEEKPKKKKSRRRGRRGGRGRRSKSDSQKTEQNENTEKKETSKTDSNNDAPKNTPSAPPADE